MSYPFGCIKTIHDYKMTAKCRLNLNVYSTPLIGRCSIPIESYSASGIDRLLMCPVILSMSLVPNALLPLEPLEFRFTCKVDIPLSK